MATPRQSLFNTAPATSLAYAFIKKDVHFSNGVEVKVDDGYEYHRLFQCKKIPKESKPNSHRNQKEWLMNHNTCTNPDKVDRQNATIVLMGEIYRFEIGVTQPKYRIVKNNDRSFPITEIVEGYQSFFDYACQNLTKTTYANNQYLHGLGRVSFNKWLYLENDYQFKNMCLNKDNYFVGIDHDRSLAPLVLKFKTAYETDHLKKYLFRNYDSSVKHLSREKKDKLTWLIKDKNMTDMGDIHLDDYQYFPLITHYLATNWQFEAAQNYSKFLCAHPTFLNEKHFSALKSTVTQFIKRELIQLHIAHEQDQKEITELVTNRMAEMQNILTKSTDFIRYFIENGMDALHLILYEVQQFLMENKHYRYTEPDHQNTQWKKITENIIQEYNALHQLITGFELEEHQKETLLTAAEGIAKQDKQVLERVNTAYSKQGMQYDAERIQSKTNANQILRSAGPG